MTGKNLDAVCVEFRDRIDAIVPVEPQRVAEYAATPHDGIAWAAHQLTARTTVVAKRTIVPRGGMGRSYTERSLELLQEPEREGDRAIERGWYVLEERRDGQRKRYVQATESVVNQRPSFTEPGNLSMKYHQLAKRSITELIAQQQIVKTRQCALQIGQLQNLTTLQKQLGASIFDPEAEFLAVSGENLFAALRYVEMAPHANMPVSRLPIGDLELETLKSAIRDHGLCNETPSRYPIGIGERSGYVTVAGGRQEGSPLTITVSEVGGILMHEHGRKSDIEDWIAPHSEPVQVYSITRTPKNLGHIATVTNHSKTLNTWNVPDPFSYDESLRGRWLESKIIQSDPEAIQRPITRMHYDYLLAHLIDVAGLMRL